MRLVGRSRRKISANTRTARKLAAIERDPHGFAFLLKSDPDQTLDERRRTRYLVEGEPHGPLHPAQSYNMKCKHDDPECTDSDCLRPLRGFVRLPR